MIAFSATRKLSNTLHPSFHASMHRHNFLKARDADGKRRCAARRRAHGERLCKIAGMREFRQMMAFF